MDITAIVGAGDGESVAGEILTVDCSNANVEGRSDKVGGDISVVDGVCEAGESTDRNNGLENVELDSCVAYDEEKALGVD